MQEYSHNCLSCKTSYKDTDPDPYYCSLCVEKRKKIAQQIDAKLVNRVTQHVESDLQRYDRLRTSKGFVMYKNF